MKQKELLQTKSKVKDEPTPREIKEQKKRDKLKKIERVGMANPQAENGHIDIANEIVEAFARYFPGGSEGQLLWAILRKTYGWHKKEDKVSISQLETMTGLSRRMVIYSLQNLESKKMIEIKRSRGRGIKNEINQISFQKNYDKWVVQEKSKQYRKALEKRKDLYKKSKEIVVQENGGSARNCNLVVQEIENDVPLFAPTKETITKETITKEKYSVDFLSFYNFYPNRKEQKAAFKAWKKLNGTRPPIETLLEAIKKQIEWRKNANGEFRPEWKHPATWLNKGCWDDEIINPIIEDKYANIKRKYGYIPK